MIPRRNREGRRGLGPLGLALWVARPRQTYHGGEDYVLAPTKAGKDLRGG